MLSLLAKPVMQFLWLAFVAVGFSAGLMAGVLSAIYSLGVGIKGEVYKFIGLEKNKTFLKK